jgi:CxxC-x17-CxxC domain-containing protein
MGNFNRNKGFGGKDRGFSRGSSRPSRGFNNRSGGRGFGGGDRSFGGGRDREERRRPEMHSSTCAKCGQECQVPFKPTGEKPVYCRACFGKNEGSFSNKSNNFKPQNAESSGISKEQFKELNSKLDRILKILENIEFEEEEPEDEEDF